MIQLGTSKTVMFPLGILAGYLAKQNLVVNKISLFLYFIGCIILILVSRKWCDYNFSTFRSLLGIPFVCILLESLNKNLFLKNFFAFCGRYSLELYLLHVICYFFLVEVTVFPKGLCMALGIVFSFITCQRINFLVNKIQTKVAFTDIKHNYKE